VSGSNALCQNTFHAVGIASITNLVVVRCCSVPDHNTTKVIRIGGAVFLYHRINSVWGHVIRCSICAGFQTDEEPGSRVGAGFDDSDPLLEVETIGFAWYIDISRTCRVVVKLDPYVIESGVLDRIGQLGVWNRALRCTRNIEFPAYN
jgi:hypothetical protein